MAFNSLTFALFLPIVFFLYWFAIGDNRRLRTAFLLLVSYIFYGWWDYRFLGLIFLSSVVDYLIGRAIHQQEAPQKRKYLLWTSLAVNLGLLGFFKYYNFFVDSFVDAFSFVGLELHLSTLSIILPVGISFYTFQTLSYTIDIYRKKLEPCQDFLSFAAFVSFFPQLVAGPIERASHLLPQFYTPKKFSFAQGKEGLRLILWGLFKKVVIADTCALYVNDCFANYEEYGVLTLFLGGFYFTWQVYGDFSGYSDIAIGTAKLFGFDLRINFAYPYFARDVAEYWRRWHISLSTWFRDYLYIPLGGSRAGTWGTIRNMGIVFIVSGFWHGADWTFVLWGLLHAILMAPLVYFGVHRKHIEIVAKGKYFPTIKETFQMASTFTIICLGLIFFRCSSVPHAIDYFHRMLTGPIFPIEFKTYLPLIAGYALWEWFMREREHGLQLDHLPRVLRWGSYLGFTLAVLYFWGGEEEFFYFQF